MAGRTTKAAEKKGGASQPRPASLKSAVNAEAQKLAERMRARVRKVHGDDAAPDPDFIANVEAIPSGSQALDIALGVGGWARRKIHSIQGPEHSGKTALALLAIAAAQGEDPSAIAVFENVERRYSESLARVVGVDLDRLVILQPDTAEEACEMAMEAMGYVKSAKGDWSDRPEEEPARILVYDSWAGSATRGVAMAELARIGSIWWPKLSIAVERSNCAMLVTNHIRFKPGVVYGNPEYGPGGEAFKHAQTSRVEVHKEGEVEKDSAGTRIGHTMRINIVKNGLAAPFKVVRLHLNYYGGFDRLKDAYEVAALKGLSFKETPTGNMLVLADPESGEVVIRANGEKNFFSELRGDPDAAELFIELVRKWEPNGS